MLKYLFISIFFIPFTLHSQVVNIEKKRFTDTNKLLQGNIDLALIFTKSTKDIIQGKNNIRLQYYKDQTTWLLFHDLTIMKVDTESYLNSGFQHLRYNYDFSNKWLIAEAFTQLQYNKIKKLQRRFLWGGGTRYRILDKKKVNFYAGMAVMYEFELLLNEDHFDTFRLSSYLSGNFSVKDNLSFNHITYYQPSLAFIGDYRISSETNMQIKISKKLSFKVAFNLTYDSQPPEGVQEIFYTLNNGISYRF